MDIFYIIFSAGYLLLLVVTVLFIVTDRSNSNPGNAIAWLTLILFFPLIGVLLYLVFGLNRRRIYSSDKEFKAFLDVIVPKLPHNTNSFEKEINQYLEKADPAYQGLIKLHLSNNYSRLLYGSEVEIITKGSLKFQRLIEDMKNATDHIHFECFLFRRDEVSREIRAILMKKASEGVKVRFVYDNIANIDILPSYYNKMRKSGVEVNAFTKLSLPSIRRSLNNRNHRKLIVIDGKIGYVGGMNITSQTLRWRDTHLRIKGQGVHGLQMNFLNIWFGSGGTLPDEYSHYFPKAPILTQNLMQIVPEAPNGKYPYYALSVVKAIENAKKYIYIQTPYFLPTDALKRALISAALSGAEVRLMVSRKSDFVVMDWAIQGNYEEMLEAGIYIHEIQDYFSHAKSMVIDDYLSITGSSNLDYRSLELNFEINSFMYDAEVASRNKIIFLNDMNDCKELTLEEWRKRPWYKRILQTIMRFFTPLL